MKKLTKIVLYLILIIGILFGTIYFGSSPIMKKIISEKIDGRKIGGIYKASFKNAYFNIFQMGINVYDFELKADSSAESKKLFKHHKHLAYIQIDRVNITEIDILALIKDKQIIVQKIVFKRPLIDLYKNLQFTKALEKDSIDIESGLKEIQLKSIIIDNLLLNYFLDDDKKSDIQISELDLKLINPIIDLSKINEPLNAISIDDIKISLKNIKFEGTKELYNASLKTIPQNIGFD